MSFFASACRGHRLCARRATPAQFRAPRHRSASAPPRRADAMLALVKQGKVEKMTQRRVRVAQSVVPRPRPRISSFLIYAAVMSGAAPRPWLRWPARCTTRCCTGSSIRARRGGDLAIAGDSAAGGTKTNACPVSAEKLRRSETEDGGGDCCVHC